MKKTLSVCINTAAALLCCMLAACSHLSDAKNPAPQTKATRAQLSIGYTLLYQEADGIPKLKWLLMFKNKPEEMSHVVDDLVSYYQSLAASLEKLSQQYPAVHIDAVAMSSIEAETRKAMGEDNAKDFAPLVGKSGIEFERQALLMFYDALDEQRHLAKVMLGMETVPALRAFLETTKNQLDERHAKVGALLNRRYFTH